MSKFDTLSNRLFSKVAGGIYGLISSVIAGLGDILSLQFFPNYSIVNDMVSELGITSGGIFFNFGLIISGLIGLAFYYSLSKVFLKENRLIRKCALISSYLSCITFSLIGVFPAYQEKELILSLYLHGTFAALSWITGSMYCFFFSILMMRNKFYTNYLAYYGFFCSALFIILLLTWIPILEWSLSFAIFGYVIFNSIYLIKINTEEFSNSS